MPLTTNATRTATVFVRHSSDCKDKHRGSQWRKCTCRKSLLVYDGETKKQRKISSKTRSWEKAEGQAQSWLDQFDPLKIELKRLQDEKAARLEKAKRIEDAVGGYLADMIFRLGDNSTVDRTRTLLGYVDPKTAEVRRNGKLFDWLDKQVPRPIVISDITPAQLAAWRNSWDYKSDLTAAASWTNVKTFFKFCKAHGWITSDPAAELRRPSVTKGNRTGTFSDEQYETILAAARGNQRLESFLELLRWSAMALIDAVQFESQSIDPAGILRYTRIKTGTLATVPLPEHVVALVRNVPRDQGNSAEQPFRRQDIGIESAIGEWRRELQALFAKAGITEVKTDVGPRPPHPHMLRDTAAVWYLRHGMSLHGVSKILGHSNPAITARSYLPFVTELEKAHISEALEVLKAATKTRLAAK